MPEKLPIHRIPDFATARALTKGFYIADIQLHGQKHDFIQVPHKHDFYLLLYISQGQGTHTIDFTPYPLQPGSVFFLTPGQVHTWDLPPDAQGTLLFFSQEFYHKSTMAEQLRQLPFFRAWQNPPVLYASVQDLQPAEALLQQLQQEYATPALYQPDALRAYLDLLLIQLARLYPATASLHEGNNWPFQLYQLETLVEQHYREHQPVGFYAQELHLSAKYLNELCKQNLGKTITDLLKGRLILEAKRLLTHSPHLTIAQVADFLGFDDNSYFSRFFKKEAGLTPDQFRHREHTAL